MQSKVTKDLLIQGREYSERVLKGLTAGVSHFHAVQYMKNELKDNGFNEIREVDKWNLTAGQSYYFTRNESTIVAFTLGKQVEKGVDLFKIVGCHTDSPVLKLAPHSKIDNKYGFQQMNMQCYGGGLWRTWFDRDLGLAGKIIIQDKKDKTVRQHLWDSKDALMNVPSLCIHLAREPEFNPSKENHLKPILATHAIDQLMDQGKSVFSEENPDVYRIEKKNFASFLDRIASDLGVTMDEIVDFELTAYDHHPPALMGLHKEFICSPRLDNLCSSLCSVDSIIEHAKSANLDNSEVSMIMLFDHEEIGSSSATGADSNMLNEATERVFDSACHGSKEDYFRSIKRSYFISADMAHAVHPNYPEKHQGQHHPRIHDGIVLKINANQRYMTDSASAALLRILAANASPPVPLQDFMVRQDGLCGSTIGPMIASKAGIKTIDIGAPQLSMHSIRETCGVIDVLYYKFLFSCFFNDYNRLSHSLFNS
jgi:aspartyl aminopeptidase